MKNYLVLIIIQFIVYNKIYAQFYKIDNDEDHFKIEHADPVYEDLTTDLGSKMKIN